jgi:hypothetical protein
MKLPSVLARFLTLLGGFDLPQQPHHAPPPLWIRRQHVDDVGPVVASPVAVAEQVRGDRVALGLVVDQDAAQGVAGGWVERLEDGSEFSHARSL